MNLFYIHHLLNLPYLYLSLYHFPKNFQVQFSNLIQNLNIHCSEKNYIGMF